MYSHSTGIPTHRKRAATSIATTMTAAALVRPIRDIDRLQDTRRRWLPGLRLAAVRAADGRRDRRLEGRPAAAGVQRAVLGAGRRALAQLGALDRPVRPARAPVRLAA